MCRFLLILATQIFFIVALMSSQNMAVLAELYTWDLSFPLLSDQLFMFRQVVIKHLDQVGHGEMLQRVLCRVGMRSVLLDMVRLLSQLLRSVETVPYYSDYLFWDLYVWKICTSFSPVERFLFIYLDRTRTWVLPQSVKRILKALVCSPVIKDCRLCLTLRCIYSLCILLPGSIKHKTPTFLDHAEKTAFVEADKQLRLLLATSISQIIFIFSTSVSSLILL